jgi:hypothetical protein
MEIRGSNGQPCAISHTRASYMRVGGTDRDISRSSCTIIVNSFETCTAQTSGKSQSSYAFWQSCTTAGMLRFFKYAIGSLSPAAGKSFCLDAGRGG